MSAPPRKTTFFSVTGYMPRHRTGKTPIVPILTAFRDKKGILHHGHSSGRLVCTYAFAILLSHGSDWTGHRGACEPRSMTNATTANRLAGLSRLAISLRDRRVPAHRSVMQGCRPPGTRGAGCWLLAAACKRACGSVRAREAIKL